MLIDSTPVHVTATLADARQCEDGRSLDDYGDTRALCPRAPSEDMVSPDGAPIPLLHILAPARRNVCFRTLPLEEQYRALMSAASDAKRWADILRQWRANGEASESELSRAIAEADAAQEIARGCLVKINHAAEKVGR